MPMRDTIEAILRDALQPVRLEVIDESHQHAGHSGARAGGETHFRVRVSSSVFDGRSRLDRHRAVNALLAAPLREGVHALAIEAHGTADGEATWG